jgi:hypothetical protein
MRHWILTLLAKLTRLSTDSAPTCRPTLEQLEDRCVPSANMMMSMGMTMPSMTMPSMTMQPTTMPSMNMPSMGTNMTSNMLNPATMAAIDHLFMDFNQTLQQVLSSTTMQQFITNEVHMIDVLATDIAQIRMLV